MSPDPVEVTEDMLRELRDRAEAIASCAQMALGWYASGSPVEPERKRASVEWCAHFISNGCVIGGIL